MTRRLAHVIGFDDAPFDRQYRGDVLVVYAGARLEGVLSGKVRRDGANATRVLIDLVRGSRFAAHVQAILLQGIAFAGFNVVDVQQLSAALAIAVVVAARRRPDLEAVRRALLDHVPGGARKWRLIELADRCKRPRGYTCSVRVCRSRRPRSSSGGCKSTAPCPSRCARRT
jgi:endonuclease V-like protein UPF0215 family